MNIRGASIKIKIFFPVALIAFIVITAFRKEPATGLIVSQIRCSGLENPIGTYRDPDFSWILKARHRGQIQTAYQIIAGTDSNLIETNKNIVWNSGLIVSDKTSWIPYEGTSLESGKEYFWRVRSWDEENKPSDWSKAGKFVTGLFIKDDWSAAKWIGYEDIPDSLL